MSKIRLAMKHSNALGAGAAARREHLKTGQDKIQAVMSEFKRGTLHSGGSGKVVTNRKQAVAIAMHESKLDKIASRYKGKKGKHN